MAFLQDVMMQLMDLIYAYTNSYGIAIILITIFIKVALMPLTFIQLNSMKKMQEMAPMQKKLQEKYIFLEMEEEGNSQVVRICTTWGTKPENVDLLIQDLKKLLL